MLLGQWHLRGGDQQVASLLLAVTTTTSATLITLALMGYAASIKTPLSETLVIPGRSFLLGLPSPPSPTGSFAN